MMSHKVNFITIGVPTFGNLPFTRMTVEHIRKTVEKTPYEIVVVVGKPDDADTYNYCKDEGIPVIRHLINKGLPAAINDIYDHAFVLGNSDAVVIVGNDVLPYWGGIDELVYHANTTDFDWISGSEITKLMLVNAVPECRSYFAGGEKNSNFTRLSLDEFLDKYPPHRGDIVITDISKEPVVGDSHNMCLFTRDLFEHVGYIDVNFYPAYYEDNDYSRRCQLLGVNMCKVTGAEYFHFWSRTIHQGDMKSTNDKYFPLNKEFYKEKWGGKPGKEKFSQPFNGAVRNFGAVIGAGGTAILDRENEDLYIRYWRNLGDD